MNNYSDDVNFTFMNDTLGWNVTQQVISPETTAEIEHLLSETDVLLYIIGTFVSIALFWTWIGYLQNKYTQARKENKHLTAKKRSESYPGKWITYHQIPHMRNFLCFHPSLKYVNKLFLYN